MTDENVKAESSSAAPAGGIPGLCEALVRAAERRSGSPAQPAGRALMAALAGAFETAESGGSVCVRSADVVARLRNPEDLTAGLEELARLGLAQPLGAFLQAAKEAAEGRPAAAFTPIVIDGEGDGARIYFARQAMQEVRLARSLLRLGAAEAGRAPDAAELETIGRVTAAAGAGELQRRAVELALTRRFAVISGGPGTGKTTTVAQILECLLEADPELRVALAAPTGKAAGRMEQSLAESVARAGLGRLAAALAEDALRPDGERRIRSRTIHKWLLTPTGTGERPGPENPLEAGVLIVDEASMIDIGLAERLFGSVSRDTRVILLGDKHQLAAVGPGAVFAEISDAAGPLSASVVELLESRRFAEGSPIAVLAGAINHQGACAGLPEDEVFARVLEAFAMGPDGRFEARLHEVTPLKDPAEIRAYAETGLTGPARAWLDRELEGYGRRLEDYRRAFMAGAGPEALVPLRDRIWETLSQFRAIAAQRRGAMSLAAVNAYCDGRVRALWPHAEMTAEQYPGRVVIVRRNDEGLGVHNGDVGVVLPKRAAAEGEGDEARPAGYVVYFGDSGLELPAALLPERDTAWAITIHQSQGSEADRVAVFMPPRTGSGLSTRELLYTAVTRTRGTVDVFASRAVLREATATPTVRDGSLGRRLAPGALP